MAEETQVEWNEENFKQELKELLKKYNVSIGCNVEGDTHGLSYSMIVTLYNNRDWKEIKICEGQEVTEYEL